MYQFNFGPSPAGWVKGPHECKLVMTRADHIQRTKKEVQENKVK